MRVILFVILVLARNALSSDQVDDHDPILQYLNLDPIKVEKHGLADMKVSDEEDDLISLGFRVFGHNIKMWLHPVDSILITDDTPVFVAETLPNDTIVYHRVKNALVKLGKLYEDPVHLASVTIGYEPGKFAVNGHMKLGDASVMIRSVPSHVAGQYLRKRRSAEDPTLDSHQNSTYHAVIHLKEENKDDYINEAIPLPEAHRDKGPRNKKRELKYPERVNNTLYPEILVYVDSSYRGDWTNDEWMRTEDTFNRFLEYLLAFWNGVDLAYRNIENPRIRMNIAAIVLAKDLGAVPFIKKTQLGRNAFDRRRAMNIAAEFFYDHKKTFGSRGWDMAVVLTKRALDPVLLYNGSIGIAFRSGICQSGLQTISGKKVNAEFGVAIVLDDGLYKGITTAAHEIGHALSLNHDLRNPNCLDRDGYLMSPFTRPSQHESSLSRCSLRELQKAFNMGRHGCLLNKPVTAGKELPKLIPGKIVTWQKQCEMRNEGPPCKHPGDDTCVQLYCRKKGEIECAGINFTPPAGTLCQHPKTEKIGFCLQNTCTIL